MLSISYDALLTIAGILLALVLLAVVVILVLWNKNNHLKIEKEIAELELEHLNLQLENRKEKIKLQSEIIAKNAEFNTLKDTIMSKVLATLSPSSLYNLRVNLRDFQKNSGNVSSRAWKQVDAVLNAAYNK